MIVPNVGNSASNVVFKDGFFRLSVIALTGSITIVCGGKTMTLPTGLPMAFEAPNRGSHGEVSVTSVGGSFAFQEYR